jgi:hypothetical protein
MTIVVQFTSSYPNVQILVILDTGSAWFTIHHISKKADSNGGRGFLVLPCLSLYNQHGIKINVHIESIKPDKRT